jgi:hypothetical protein
MQDEEVNKLYNLYILSWETLSTNYKIKTLQQKEKDVEQFMKVHALMKQKQLSYTMLGSEAQNSPVEKKQDNKIITLQVLLYTRIRKNNGDAQDYNDVRIFLENVYILRE